MALANLFSALDAEVKRLDREPKAQAIFDEAKKVIYEAVSENKRECMGQLQDLSVQTQRKFDGLAHDISAMGSELRMTQTMLGGKGYEVRSPPGVPTPHAAGAGRTRFFNWNAGCGDDECDHDHSGADRHGRGRGGGPEKGLADKSSRVAHRGRTAATARMSTSFSTRCARCKEMSDDCSHSECR